MNQMFYVLKGSDQSGPFTLNQMTSMWKSGAITADSYYWTEGLPEWRSIMAIASLLEPPPAPPPRPKTPPPIPPQPPRLASLSPVSHPSAQPIEKQYTMAVEPNGNIQFSTSSLAGAKQGLEEMKLYKKAYQIKKKELQAQAKVIHQNYTAYTRNRGHMFRGGKGLGRFIRIMQASNRDSHKRELAHSLRPIENEISKIDVVLLSLEKAMVELTYKIQNFPR